MIGASRQHDDTWPYRVNIDREIMPECISHMVRGGSCKPVWNTTVSSFLLEFRALPPSLSGSCDESCLSFPALVCADAAIDRGLSSAELCSKLDHAR